VFVFRLIIGWRRRLLASLYKKAAAANGENKVEQENGAEEKAEEEEEENDNDDEEDKDIEEQLLELNEQQRKEAKRFEIRFEREKKNTFGFCRKRKHIMKEKRKLRDRLALKMVLPGDVHDHETIDGGRNDQGLFDLEKIRTKKVDFYSEKKKQNF